MIQSLGFLPIATMSSCFVIAQNGSAADDELIPISVQPDGQTWASVRVAPVQEWFVTNTFSF
jgi:hypothetical protein